MAVRKKARAFVEKLWLKIAPKYSQASEQKLDSAFKDVVSNLPDGKLKKELASNLVEYCALLSKLRQAHCTAEEDTADAGDSQFPFNLLLPGEPSLNEPALRSKTEAVKLQTAALLVSRAGHRLSATNSTYDYLDSALQAGTCSLEAAKPKGVEAKQDSERRLTASHHLAVLRRMLASLPLASDAASMRRVIVGFLRHLQPAVDALLLPHLVGESHEQSLKELLQIVRSFVILLEIKNVHKLAPKIPQYDDLLAATLSCYADLDLAVSVGCTGTQVEVGVEDAAAAAAARAAGAQVAGRLLFLLRHRSPLLALDVLLQLATPPSSADLAKQALLQLYRKLLSASVLGSQVAAGTCESYVKYISTVKTGTSLFGDGATDITEAARKVPAPVQFIKWLKHADRSLLDELPTEKHFTGLRITRYLIDDAEIGLCDQILQLTYRDKPLSSELLLGPAAPLLEQARTPAAADGAQGTTEDDPEVDGLETEPLDEEQLFFIDTECNESVRQELDDELLSSRRTACTDGAEGAAHQAGAAAASGNGTGRQHARVVSSLLKEIATLDQELASDDDVPLQPLTMSVGAADLAPEITEAALSQIPVPDCKDVQELIADASGDLASCAASDKFIVDASETPATGLRRHVRKTASQILTARQTGDLEPDSGSEADGQTAAGKAEVVGGRRKKPLSAADFRSTSAAAPGQKLPGSAEPDAACSLAAEPAAASPSKSKCDRRRAASAASAAAAGSAQAEDQENTSGEVAQVSKDGPAAGQVKKRAGSSTKLPSPKPAATVDVPTSQRLRIEPRGGNVGSHSRAPPDESCTEQESDAAPSVTGGEPLSPPAAKRRTRSDSESSSCSYSLRSSAQMPTPQKKPTVPATPTRRSRRLSSASSISSDDEGGTLPLPVLSSTGRATALRSTTKKKVEKRAVAVSDAARVLSPLREDDDGSDGDHSQALGGSDSDDPNVAVSASDSDICAPKSSLDRRAAKRPAAAVTTDAPSRKMATTTPGKRAAGNGRLEGPVSAQKNRSLTVAAPTSTAVESSECVDSSQSTRYSLRGRATPSAAEH